MVYCESKQSTDSYLFRAAHKRKPGNMLIFFLEAWTAIFRVTEKLTEIKLTYLLIDLLTYILPVSLKIAYCYQDHYLNNKLIIYYNVQGI